jgi:hypothetical protein
MPSGFLHDAGGKASHGDALAAALGVPDHAAFLVATGARCFYHLDDGGTHRMELVVASNLLDQCASANLLASVDRAVIASRPAVPVRAATGQAATETLTETVIDPAAIGRVVIAHVQARRGKVASVGLPAHRVSVAPRTCLTLSPAAM